VHPITSVLLCVEHLIDLNSRQNYNRIVSLVVLLIGLVACDSYKYVTYKPHYLTSNSEHKYYGKAGLDSVEFANTKQVLTYYGEDYKTKNDSVILVNRRLAKEWGILWNYTTKANDSAWLNTHKAK
jgi:hypothetical protein